MLFKSITGNGKINRNTRAHSPVGILKAMLLRTSSNALLIITVVEVRLSIHIIMIIVHLIWILIHLLRICHRILQLKPWILKLLLNVMLMLVIFRLHHRKLLWLLLKLLLLRELILLWHLLLLRLKWLLLMLLLILVLLCVKTICHLWVIVWIIVLCTRIVV